LRIYQFDTDNQSKYDFVFYHITELRFSGRTPHPIWVSTTLRRSEVWC